MDGVSAAVVVVVTAERSEAVGVTIVEHDEGMDEYFVWRGAEKKLLSLFVMVENGSDEMSLLVESLNDLVMSSGSLSDWGQGLR